MKAESWSIKILHQGRRHTFSLGATVRQDAAIEAKAIYETIVAEGWDSALSTEKNPAGFPKTDPRFWKENLLVRCYRFPAAEEPEKSFAARIGHAGSAYFLPLGTTSLDAASRMACRIYRAVVNQGWAVACTLFPRELIVAFEWSANPIMWTYTTVHTLVGRMAQIDTGAPPAQPQLHNVVIVETEPGLRRALTWCVNHQPGFCAVPCESPENFAQIAAAHKPRLVLFNRSLPERLGIDFSGGLTVLPSGAFALAYSVSVDGDHMFASTPGGADGYMLKRIPPANILDPMLESGKLSKAAAEDRLAPVTTFFKGLLPARAGGRSEALAKLTKRENEVMMLLSQGCLDKEISTAMGISVWTVHGHIKKIFERLEVRTRTEAVICHLEK